MPKSKPEPDPIDVDPEVGCSIKMLPDEDQDRAAEVASGTSPMNSPPMMFAGRVASTGGPGDDEVIPPRFIAVMTTRYWGPTPRVLPVSFLEQTTQSFRAKVLSHLNAWGESGCIRFSWTQGTGKVRITTGGAGYWSYLGTDILLIPPNQPTMCLQGFHTRSPEAEYRRVVRHEAGHTLGYAHEHMRAELVARLEHRRTVDHFFRTQGWSERMTMAQVMTPLDQASIMGTAPDQTSIMCYQLPASITTDGKPIVGGLDINRSDHDFNARIYPRPAHLLTGRVAAQHKHKEIVT